MLRNIGIVHACLHSSHFRGNLLRKLGGRSLLEWVIRRVTDSMRLDGVIVVADRREDRDCVTALVPSDVPICFVDGNDQLAGIAKALEEYPADGVVYVRGDNLFTDSALIDRLVTSAEENPNCDYVTYCSRDGQPAILSPVGVYAEWFRAQALRKANRSARSEPDRRHVTRFIYSHPEKFQLRLIPAPAEIDRDDVRLTVDIEEDWDHVLAIYEALGAEWLDWRRIAGLLAHQPALRSRMAVLNRAHRVPIIAGDL
jgi:spore coat polysaccharide biosynthesis protein SpsF